MLFLGSIKCPDDGHYTSFVKRYGGHTNAYTSKDHTLYYFDINNSAYEEALDIFSRFFLKIFYRSIANKRMYRERSKCCSLRICK